MNSLEWLANTRFGEHDRTMSPRARASPIVGRARMGDPAAANRSGRAVRGGSDRFGSSTEGGAVPNSLRHGRPLGVGA